MGECPGIVTSHCEVGHHRCYRAKVIVCATDVNINAFASPGPTQILSRSRGEKSGEGLGAKYVMTGNGGLG